MIGALALLLSLVVVGMPVVLLIDRRTQGIILIGLSFLYGCGIAAAALLALSLVGLEWSLFRLVAILMSVFVVAVVLQFVRLPGRSDQKGADRVQDLRAWRSPLAIGASIVTLLQVVAYTLYATLVEPWGTDFWAIWGLKGRVFFQQRGIDFEFLTRGEFIHNDYPLLLPLLFDVIALANGGWEAPAFGLLYVAVAVAATLIVIAVASEETSPGLAAVIGAATIGLLSSRYVGVADPPLMAFAGAGLLLLRRGISRRDRSSVIHASILLGLAANIKNEGLAILVIALLAAALLGREIMRDTWPALVVVAPWLVLRAIHGLSTDLFAGPPKIDLQRGMEWFRLLLHYLPEPAFWAVIMLLLLFLRPGAERFLIIVSIGVIALYALVFLFTPHDLEWHVATAWARIVRHVKLPLLFVVLLTLAKRAQTNQHARHAEARLDH